MTQEPSELDLIEEWEAAEPGRSFWALIKSLGEDPPMRNVREILTVLRPGETYRTLAELMGAFQEVMGDMGEAITASRP